MAELPKDLPKPDGLFNNGFCYKTDTVRRIKREAYEAGRQHERERLEPLRAAVEAESIGRAQYDSGLISFADAAYLRRLVADAARTLLETDR